MSVTPAEIEQIVRRVLSTLVAASSSTGPSDKPIGTNSNHLRLTDSVISLDSIKHRLAGIQALEISTSAIVTPAVRDLCREKKIQLVRGTPNSSSSVGSTNPSALKPQRLIVAGATSWLTAIAKQVCNQQAHICEPSKDDATALRIVAEGLRAGHQAGLIVAAAPHSVCWQAARDERLRPAVVSQWSEIEPVLREVPANVLILGSSAWNIPSVCNAARRFFQHLKNNS